MICPKCNTENGQRSVCKNCGLFLYKADQRNAPKLSEKEIKQRDRQTILRVTKKALRFVAIIISTFVISFLVYLLLIFVFDII
jgi:uncharacterized membrane protein YvbJ